MLVMDLVLWLGLGAAAASGVTTPRDSPWYWPVLGLVLLIAGVAVLVSRRSPVLAVAIALAATSWTLEFIFLLTALSFLAGRRPARGSPVLAGIGLALAVGAVVVFLTTQPIGELFNAVVFSLLALIFPVLAGRCARLYQDLVSAGWRRAEQLESEQRILADRARLRERARIAQDMHDSLGHELSLIALRAGALEIAPDLSEPHRTAAGELRGTATTATERLRDIIGVLRDETDPAPLEPVNEEVGELVARARASGLDVELTTTGAAVLPPMVDRALYRVVQEALTNATKHAPGASVHVQVAHGDRRTAVSVVNEAPAAPPASPASGQRGLTGLRERVRLAGGTLTAGPYEGGFRVAAQLPHRGGSVPPREDPPEQSESATQFEQAQRRVVRGVLTAIFVPLGIAALLTMALLGFYLYVTVNAVLKPAQFAQLQVGQTLAQVEDLLPDLEMRDPPAELGLPTPAGARCAYYRSSTGVFNRVDVHQLCFAEDRLVLKHVIRWGN